MPGSSYYELVNDAVHMYIVSKYMYYCRLFGSGFIIQNLDQNQQHYTIYGTEQTVLQ